MTSTETSNESVAPAGLYNVPTIAIFAGLFGEGNSVRTCTVSNDTAGDVDEIHMPVHATVKAEVAEVRGHPVQVARVVAEYRDWDAIRLLLFILRRWRCGFCGGCRRLRWLRQKIGDIEDELVVSADVLARELFSDIDSGGLTRTLKVQQGPSLGERVGNLHVRSI